MKKNSLLNFLLLSLLTSLCFAKEPDNFQYKTELKVKKSAPIYQLILPFDVYQGLKQVNYSDLRILNAAGVELAASLRNIRFRRRSYYSYTQLALFPLRKSEVISSAGNVSIHFKANNKGTIVKINSNEPNKKTTNNISMYLLDASQIKYNISALKFDWETTSYDHIYSIKIEKSNDLSNWTKVTQDNLSQLKFNGQNLLRNSISFRPTKAKYYRLSWPTTQTAIAIKSIQAKYLKTKIDSLPPRRWKDIVATKILSPDDDKEHTYFEFKINAFLPADKFNIQLPATNMAFNFDLLKKHSYWTYNKRGKKLKQISTYKTIWSGGVYKISTNNTTIHNHDIEVDLSQRRTFYFRIHKNKISKNLKQLKIKISWIPHKLLFIAQGKAPYSLVFGSNKLTASRSDFDSLFKLINANHKGSLKPVTILMHSVRQQASYQASESSNQENNMSRIFIWAGLIIAVIFLGLMTKAISKQIKAEGNEADKQ